MLNYTLGTIEASEALIKDLYIDLRAKVNAWSKITQQTPQARMGYVGQHLVSVVTGYPGGKSGARGYDLVIDDERHGEIKTCYRVDQLGSCNACGAVVSSLETECAVCRSTSINRKDDSKWLIAIRNNDEFAKLLDPYHRSTRANTPANVSFRCFLPFSPWRASARLRLKSQKTFENTSSAGAEQFCRSRNGSRQEKTRREYLPYCQGA